MIRRLRNPCLALMLAGVVGCDPPYLSDTYATSTPRSFDAGELTRKPVMVLAFLTPANLQGFGPVLSHALSGALTQVSPPIRATPTDETINRLTDNGLAMEYAELRTGFARSGILDHHRLSRIH